MKFSSKHLKFKTDEQCREDLISKGFVYNEIFGWEKLEILEMYGINPNTEGVPYVLKPKWVEISSGNSVVRDEFGNSKKVNLSGGWQQHPNEKVWSPSDGWLSYLNYRKQKNIESLIPIPAEQG